MHELQKQAIRLLNPSIDFQRCTSDKDDSVAWKNIVLENSKLKFRYGTDVIIIIDAYLLEEENLHEALKLKPSMTIQFRLEILMDWVLENIFFVKY